MTRTTSTQPIEVKAAVEPPAGGKWKLTLTTRVAGLIGERHLQGLDCGEVAAAAALVVALMVGSATQEAPITTASPPAPPSPTPLARRRFAAGAQIAGGTGQLPGATAGAGVTLAIARGAFGVRGGLDVWLPHDGASAAKPSAGGSFWMIDGVLAGCAVARRERRVAPGLCAGLAASLLHARGFGVSDPGQYTAFVAQALVEGAVTTRVTARSAIRFSVGAFAPFERPTFALAGVGAVFRPSPLWLRGTLGWELNF